MVDLQSFCAIKAIEPFRPYLHQPFSLGEFSYATDGRIMLRMPRRPDIAELEITKEIKWNAPLEGHETARYDIIHHKKLPPVPALRTHECDACDGRGKEHECPDCSCECEACNGTGTESVFPKISTEIGNRIVQLRYAIMMLGLHKVEVALEGDPERLILFRFDGGIGAIMPMRSKYSEHVTIETVPVAA